MHTHARTHAHTRARTHTNRGSSRNLCHMLSMSLRENPRVLGLASYSVNSSTKSLDTTAEDLSPEQFAFEHAPERQVVEWDGVT